MRTSRRTEKMSVSLPRELAAEVRALVSEGEVSSFFADALGHYLAYRRQKAALETGFGAWKDESHPDLVESGDSTTYVRSLRALARKPSGRGRTTHAG